MSSASLKTYSIELQNLTIGYGTRIILQDINLCIDSGKIVTILGGSGCGKSTLLKHMIGLYEPLSGDILIQGKSIVNADSQTRLDIMTKFGVAYQGGALFRSMSVAENIALPMVEFGCFTKQEIEERVRKKLELVHLQGFENYMPSDLSGGMIKRVAFARALALDPQLLFFDEPSAGLDPLTSSMLDDVILDIRNTTGATIIVVTHELQSIFKISDRSIVLSAQTKGIIADGLPEELKMTSESEYVRNFLSRNNEME